MPPLPTIPDDLNTAMQASFVGIPARYRAMRLSRQDFATCIDAVFPTMTPQYRAELTTILFQHADANGDGTLDPVEFRDVVAVMKGIPRIPMPKKPAYAVLTADMNTVLATVPALPVSLRKASLSRADLQNYFKSWFPKADAQLLEDIIVLIYNNADLDYEGKVAFTEVAHYFLVAKGLAPVQDGPSATSISAVAA